MGDAKDGRDGVVERILNDLDELEVVDGILGIRLHSILIFVKQFEIHVTNFT